MTPAPLPAEQAALLRAIVAEPNEDTPRLVYADWLQEGGDEEQARYVRDSVRLAATPHDAPGRKALAERLRETRDWRGPEWLQRLGLGKRAVGFERGLPVRVVFEGANEFFAVADRLFALLPVRALEICAYSGTRLRGDAVRRLAAMPELARLTDLRFVGHEPIDPNAWRALFRSPRASGLTFLGLSGCHVGAVIATQLAAAPRLANLTDLDLSYNDIGVFGARALLDSPHLLKLRRLWLEGNFRARADGEDALAADLELRLGPGLHLHDSPADDEEEL
ncbi:MAG: TIGR02996 domain-containing protein [Gemmata sp.]